MANYRLAYEKIQKVDRTLNQLPHNYSSAPSSPTLTPPPPPIIFTRNWGDTAVDDGPAQHVPVYGNGGSRTVTQSSNAEGAAGGEKEEKKNRSPRPPAMAARCGGGRCDGGAESERVNAIR